MPNEDVVREVQEQLQAKRRAEGVPTFAELWEKQRGERERREEELGRRIAEAAPELFRVCKAALADYEQGIADEEVDGDNLVATALREVIRKIEG